MNTETTTEGQVADREVQFRLAKTAIKHVLDAIANDPRKFWLMGDSTGSYEKLIEAASAVWNTPKEKLKADFRPRKDEWERYCEQREADEKLLTHCREHGIEAE